MADQDGVDLAEARVGAPGHGAARIVEQPRAVGVFQDQRAVEAAELALVAAERRDLDLARGPGRAGGQGGNDGGGAQGQNGRDRRAELRALFHLWSSHEYGPAAPSSGGGGRCMGKVCPRIPGRAMLASGSGFGVWSAPMRWRAAP